ncbi:TadE/TadG family type IV pilus assembly protein [Gudongella sp. SC589]|uniref:TadE/TadG family type IV pilus assembly protein n=1 Tax=Gudongella sp. SC589 TaxID=3385990 RepID=UPI003904D87A
MFDFWKFKRDEQGQSLVEFALILPVLLLLLMGIIQSGIIYGGYVAVSNAAREGARIGIVEKDKNKMILSIDNAFDDSPYLEKGEITIDPANGVFVNGQSLSVTVEGKVPIIVPMMERYFEDGFYTVSKTSVMMVEGFREN